MDLDEIQSLYGELESDRVERKESVGDGERIRKAICAFANDLPNHEAPGLIFVGVTDRGDCVARPITDKVLKTLSGMRSDGSLTPFPHLEVQKHTLQNCEVAVVCVQPALAPPVQFNGVVYVRVGPTTRVATQQEVLRLSEKRRWKDLPFDVQPLPMASIADLNLDLLSAAYPISEDDPRPIPQQLAVLRFASAGHGGVPNPTVLGVLSLGREPTAYIPGAYIQFLRFDGDQLSDAVLDQKEIAGPLPQCIQQLEQLLRIQIQTAIDFTSAEREIRRPDYPLVALQQLVRNAIMHRSYEGTSAPIRINWFRDRIEIQNPGGPYGQVTRENFGQGLTDYRNPYLAAVLKDLGYVQKFGAGIAIAKAELAQNQNPPPEFDVQLSHVQVVIRERT